MEVQPIAWVHSPYGEKFGVPRQSGLAPEVESRIELSPAVPCEALAGLEGCTHIWVIFEFHLIAPRPGRATVRPPRLGGNRRIGVLASRSPFRPNPIGLSLVRLERIEGACLFVRGGDFVDGTPVLDLKPYLPYAESLPDARCAWADAAPEPLDVRFGSKAEAVLCAHEDGGPLRQLIEASLRWDPRPAYEDDDRAHGVRLGGVDVRFAVRDGVLCVDDITADSNR